VTTAQTPSDAERLARGLEEGFCGHAAWLQPAAAELRRLQAENERLLAQVHKLEMDALDLASENSILKRAETDELEARKPLPLSDEQLRAEFIPWAEIQYRHEDEFTVRDFKICLAAWSAGRRITGGSS
jgi:hypothetical protein